MAEVRFVQGRDARGRFLAFEQAVKNLMVDEASAFQNDVANHIANHKRRPGDSTGRLEQVTRSPRNRQTLTTTWRVGIPGYLNRSEAKYWRLIEQGSAGLYGKGRGFRGTPLKFRPAGFPGGRPFRSFSRKFQKPRLNGRYGNGSINMRRGTFIGNGTYLVYVKREIQPMNAYRNAFNENGWRDRIKRDFEATVRKSFLR